MKTVVRLALVGGGIKAGLLLNDDGQSGTDNRSRSTQRNMTWRMWFFRPDGYNALIILLPFLTAVVL